MHNDEDNTMSRVIEVSQMTRIFLSFYDGLRERGVSRQQALELAERFIISSISLKVDMDYMEQPQGGQILLFPAGDNPPQAT